MTPALKKDPRLGCSECPSRNLTRDPEPAHSTFTQFPVHVLINPSTAAGSREMLPRHPLINGERHPLINGCSRAREGRKSHRNLAIKRAIGGTGSRTPPRPSEFHQVPPLSVTLSKKQKNKMFTVSFLVENTDFASFPRPLLRSAPTVGPPSPTPSRGRPFLGRGWGGGGPSTLWGIFPKLLRVEMGAMEGNETPRRFHPGWSASF